MLPIKFGLLSHVNTIGISDVLRYKFHKIPHSLTLKLLSEPVPLRKGRHENIVDTDNVVNTTHDLEDQNDFS